VLFNSVEFLLFFVVVTAAYFLLPHRARWFLLLGASCYFYMAFIPVYILILAFTIGVDYAAGILIDRAEGPARRALLICSLAANIGVLVVFKYYNFFNQTFGSPLPPFSWLLPIGLSFHTFQAMSYTIEVYRRHQKPERHFGIYALYVMFYPQLVAGPIERPQNLLPQFHGRIGWSNARFVSGLQLMLWGLFKKMVLADHFAGYADAGFASHAAQAPAVLAFAVYCFAFQIYFDFSGYSDVAIGAARVMGFDLMKNFRSPYLSVSVQEFWKRWHISLSSWFRDYVYLPLGGNRVSRVRMFRNIFVVFLLSGLWHGANWTFVVWGALHGTYIVMGMLTRGVRERIGQAVGFDRFPRSRHALRVLITFHLVLIAWVFFRATSIEQALDIIARLPSALTVSEWAPGWQAVTKLWPMRDLCLLAVLAGIVTMLEREEVPVTPSSKPLRAVFAMSALAWGILVFGVYDKLQFIYFQF
jgi:alginate O-acetyltransferase complex protein AlgI